MSKGTKTIDFDKGKIKTIQGERIVLSINIAGTTGYPRAKLCIRTFVL